MTVDLRSIPSYETYAAAAGPVRITPNRDRLDDRFPVLCFTVDTGGRPFFEVLLTSDRSLFDGANAGRRTRASFFASREHGLMRGGSEPAVYHVPTAVLQGFVGAREIFYTAVAYDSEQATNPAFAHAPASLTTGAPSVTLSADFRGQTMAAMLSVPVEKLLRVRDDSVAAPASSSPAVGADAYSDAPATWSLEAEADADRVDGEDGYGESASLEEEDEEGYAEPAPQPMQAVAYDDGYDDGFEGAIAEPAPAMAAAAPYASAYGDESEWDEPQPEAMGSSYPTGAAPPEMLEDEDERTRYGEDETAQAYGESYDDVPQYQPLDAPAPVPQELTPQEQVRILQLIGRQFESGPDGYSATRADASTGLSFGLLGFKQDSGALGAVLAAMQQRDPAKFADVFGAQAAELLRVTNATDRAQRLQPVGGKNLGDEAWLPRFRAAGAHPAFQAAQNEVAARAYIGPILAFARAAGLDSQRALAMLVDRSIHMGPTAARNWLLDTITPVPTEALRNTALRAVGMSADGWGPEAHVALIAALRALPAGRSPVPIPTRSQMLDAIVRRAQTEGQSWARRPAALRTSNELSDDMVFAL